MQRVALRNTMTEMIMNEKQLVRGIDEVSDRLDKVLIEKIEITQKLNAKFDSYKTETELKKQKDESTIQGLFIAFTNVC